MSIVKPKTTIKRSLQSVFVSIGIHLCVFVVAGGVVVYKYVKPPKMMFEAKISKTKIKARKIEHAIRVKQFEKNCTKPSLSNKLISQAPASLNLPDLPEVKSMHQSSLSLSQPTLNSLAQLDLNSFNLGNDFSALESASEAVFFGQKIMTRSFVILVDSSSSIVKKGVFDDLRQEAISTITKFQPDTLFNVILFCDGAFAFATNLVYASQQQKTLLTKWMTEEMKINRGNNPATSGSSPCVALKDALLMNPDTIILISDDPPYLKGIDSAVHHKSIFNLVKKHNHGRNTKTQINTIAYKPKASKNKKASAFLKKIAYLTGGFFKQID